MKVKSHRPRKEGAEGRVAHDFSFTYEVLVGDAKEKVCVDAFKSLYGIKISRMRRLRSLLVLGKSPKDLRGKKLGTNAIRGNVRLLIREYIDSFTSIFALFHRITSDKRSYPVKQSKYAGKTINYLDARLNVKILYSMFKERHPEAKCSYKFFLGYFKDNFTLRFGRPQIDSCCTCEELNLKLRSPHLSDAANRNAAAELMLHKRRLKKFYNKLQNESNPETKQNEPHVLEIAFDYMQNIPLPMIPVQETYYLKHLSVNFFSIHDVKCNKGHVYVYHEDTARKSPDEVCSFVYNYLMSAPPQFTEVHVYSDNCGGQNKNHALNRVFLALTDTGRFDRIEQYYPIRGHWYLPCDRDFAVIKRKLKRYDRLYTVHQITELIITSSATGKFTVEEVATEDIVDFQKWWPTFYKKSCTWKKHGERKFLLRIR